VREYRIVLSEVFYTLSWRRFMSLVAGLSKDSSFMLTLVHSDPKKPVEDNPHDIAGDIMRQRKAAKRT
jgi:hypothetical protein